MSGDSSAAWAAIRAEKAAKEQTEMIKVVGVVLAILGAVYMYNRQLQSRNKALKITSNMVIKA